MRGTECKRLRKLAREATAGKPERRLLGQKHGKSYMGKDGKPVQYTMTTAVNDPNTMRGTYRMLKKYRATTIQPRSKANG